MMRYLLVRKAAQTASRLDPELRRDYQRLKFPAVVVGCSESGHRTKNCVWCGAAVLEAAGSSTARAVKLACGVARQVLW